MYKAADIFAAPLLVYCIFVVVYKSPPKTEKCGGVPLGQIHLHVYGPRANITIIQMRT